MGRNYSGDIEGKFWFGVQASNAADRFGTVGYEPAYLEYCFTKDNIDAVKIEIDHIKETIGEDNLKLLDSFFESESSYNDEIMETFKPGLSSIWEKHKTDYADLQLGLQIYNHLLENEYCEFTAEL